MKALLFIWKVNLITAKLTILPHIIAIYCYKFFIYIIWNFKNAKSKNFYTVLYWEKTAGFDMKKYFTFTL